MAFTHPELHEPALKSLVDNLSRHLKAHPLSTLSPKRAALQELVAGTLGWPNWHAAIAAARAKAAPPAPSQAAHPWALPVAGLCLEPFPPTLGRTLCVADDAPVWRVPVRDLTTHARLQGPEAARRAFLEEVARLNPDRPLLLIHGPASLPLRRWDGSRAPAMTFARALQTQPASVLVDRCAAAIVQGDRTNSLWKGRAIALLSAVLIALVHLRDESHVPLTPASIAEWLVLRNLEALARRRDLAPPMIQAIKSYLRSIPGYQEGALGHSETVLEQHGYLQMQLASLLDNPPGYAQALWWPAGSKVPSRACLAPQDGSKADDHYLDAIVRSLDAWAQGHPGGLVVLDGLNPLSSLWETLVMRLPHWQDAGVGAWVGVGVEQDLPPGVLGDRLAARLRGRLCLARD